MKNIIILLVIIFVSCKSKSDQKPEMNYVELEQLKSSIDSLFNSEIGENEPGTAILVSYDGKMIIGKGYGLRDLDSKQPITKSTNMRMASVSKQFTALNVLSLVDKGLISLKDTVYNYLPYDAFKKVTIEQLINHTSGIADYEAWFMSNWDCTKVAVNNDVLKWYALNPKPLFKPGVKWEYSNGAYNLLATIVEKVTDQEFSNYAKENVFKKANMLSTNYFNLAKPIQINNRAFCYEKDTISNTWKKVDGHFLNGLLGEGAVYTSVNDYYEYDIALRNKTILSSEAHELIFKPSSTFKIKGIDRHYAMGWGVTDSTATHSGGWFGTNTFTKRYLNKPLTIAVFMNRNTLFKNGLVKKTDSLVLNYIKITTKKDPYK